MTSITDKFPGGQSGETGPRLREINERLDELVAPENLDPDDTIVDLGECPARHTSSELESVPGLPGDNSQDVHQLLHYQELFDFAPDGYIVTDEQGIIVNANFAASHLLETPKQFLIGKPIPFFVAMEARSVLYNWLTHRDQHNAVEHWETLLQPPRGTTRHCALTVSAMVDQQNRLEGFRWLLRDITSHKRAEQNYLSEKNLADSLVNTVEAVVLVIDESDCITRSNPFLHRLSGYDWNELRERHWMQALLTPEDHPAAVMMIRTALADGSCQAVALRLLTKSGQVRSMVWSANVPERRPEGARLVLLGFDVTELHEAQQCALQSERLAAIGQMVTGLAHESRNALQRSQSCLSILTLRLHDRPEILSLLARVQNAQDDLHQLYETVREYAAPIRLERKRTNVGNIWREAWFDLGSLSEQAELQEEIDNVDLYCEISPFHLRQVFRNLLENALNANLDSRAPVLIRADSEGDFLRVAILDHGPGFNAEARANAFKPFFTTKARGTGLGLAICQRLIEAHGGQLELGDGPSGGEVVLHLPRRV